MEKKIQQKEESTTFRPLPPGRTNPVFVYLVLQHLVIEHLLRASVMRMKSKQASTGMGCLPAYHLPAPRNDRSRCGRPRCLKTACLSEGCLPRSTPTSGLGQRHSCWESLWCVGGEPSLRPGSPPWGEKNSLKGKKCEASKPGPSVWCVGFPHVLEAAVLVPVCPSWPGLFPQSSAPLSSPEL